jgi:DNA polymerase
MQPKTLKDSILDFFLNLQQDEGEYLPFQFDNFQSNITYEKNLFTNPTPQQNLNLNKNDAFLNNIKKTEEPDLQNIPNQEDDWKNAETLDKLYNKIHTCKKCKFGNTRKNFVFGSGNSNAQLMLVGEAPGADEDEQGEPFVGRAGQLLTKIIESINFTREEIYIANIVKCRPPENKTPTEDEYKDCLPYLLKQINLIKPKFILTLGAVPLKALMGNDWQISKCRGKVYDYNGITLIPTFHPAYLLRNPNAKKDVWEDVKLLRKLFDKQITDTL